MTCQRLPAVGRAVHVLAADVDACCGRAARCGTARPRRSGTSRPPPGRWTGRATPRRCGTAAGSPRSARRCRRPCPSRTRVDQMMFGVGRDRASPSRSRRRPPSATSRAGCRAAAAAQAAVARPAVRRLVLLVAETLYGISLSVVDVVHLRVGQPLAEPRAPAVDRDRQALVVADDHAVGVGRVDPDVVVVAARRLGARGSTVSVWPPSIDLANDAVRKYVSFSSSGATAMRE